MDKESDAGQSYELDLWRVAPTMKEREETQNLQSIDATLSANFTNVVAEERNRRD